MARYLRSPTAVPAGTPWTNAVRAYDDGGAGFATTVTDGAYQQYGTYGFTDPGGENTITKVRIRYDAWSPTGEKIDVAYSTDGGTNWTSLGAAVPATTETTYWWDITSGRTWTWTLLSDANFRTRVTASKTGSMAAVDLDWIPVEVMTPFVVTDTATITDVASIIMKQYTIIDALALSVGTIIKNAEIIEIDTSKVGGTREW